MKFSSILLLFSLIAFTSCSTEFSRQSASVSADKQKTIHASEAAVQEQVEMKPVSLTDADKSESTAGALERKIIRNADLTMEVTSTTEAQHRVTSVAESHGGFVVTSEAKQREGIEPANRALDIKLVVRIPATQFAPALDEIKRLATNLREENVTGQDVTEEFIDLEARIKTQKALELQFMEIMKQAKKVADALEVQRQIADVRTEIEKLEGRKRFLDNRASLSTITVNIQAPKPIAVNTTGFGHSVRDAVSDSIELASVMVLFVIRFVIVMIPVFALVLLPLGLTVRYLMRRAKRLRLAQALATPSSSEA
jgi:Domain of unknown function (DUF4349)